MNLSIFRASIHLGRHSRILKASRCRAFSTHQTLNNSSHQNPPTTGHAVTVREFHEEDPLKSTSLEEYKIDELKASEVMVKMLSANVNPSDIYAMTGIGGYGSEVPFVPGFEGVGEVIQVGDKVENFSLGDWVLPGSIGFGTWRTHKAVDATQGLFKTDKRLGLAGATTMFVNPTTAYCLLKDVVDLKPGDTVIQNAANSACGQSLIQFAAEMGINTINIVRDRADLEEVKAKLKGIGATVVVTQDEIMKRDINDQWPDHIPAPKLAIDAIGGREGSDLIRYLPNQSVLAVYGLLSGKEIKLNSGELIFRRIRVTGFFMPDNIMTTPNRYVEEILPFKLKMIQEGRFVFPEVEKHHISNYENAINTFLKGYSGKKQMLIMDKELM